MLQSRAEDTVLVAHQERYKHGECEMKSKRVVSTETAVEEHSAYVHRDAGA